MTKVQIQSDEAASLSSANLNQNRIFLSAEPLLADKAHIVTGVPKDSCEFWSKVFVQLELQLAASTGTSKYRPRAVSAP